NRRSVAFLWREKKKPTARSLQAVGWKLGLTYRQFLPSPDAPVVLVLIMVMEVVAEIDHIDFPSRVGAEAPVKLARDNIPELRITWSKSNARSKNNGAKKHLREIAVWLMLFDGIVKTKEQA